MYNKILVIGICTLMFLVIFTIGCFENGNKNSEENDVISTADKIYGVSLKIVTKSGGDGDHEPFNSSMHKVDPSIGTQYLLLVKNRGNTTDSFKFSSNAPSGWTVQFEGGNEVQNVPKGEWTYKTITVMVSTETSDSYKEIKITATSIGNSSKQANVTTKNIVEALPPGTANIDDHPASVDYNLVYYGGGTDLNESGWYHNQGGEFYAKDNTVIIGFEEAIIGMVEGQTKVVEIPSEKGYGPDDPKHVGGRPLVFEITMLDINTEN